MYCPFSLPYFSVRRSHCLSFDRTTASTSAVCRFTLSSSCAVSLATFASASLSPCSTWLACCFDSIACTVTTRSRSSAYLRRSSSNANSWSSRNRFSTRCWCRLSEMTELLYACSCASMLRSISVTSFSRLLTSPSSAHRRSSISEDWLATKAAMALGEPMMPSAGGKFSFHSSSSAWYNSGSPLLRLISPATPDSCVIISELIWCTYRAAALLSSYLPEHFFT
mmetsp:Transcript_9003/g.19846  ORF Transcript_9003/g.19846 Transcript_9003/m.19846 type:complete len:224 (-) Transcript_9003:248-919(-)